MSLAPRRVARTHRADAEFHLRVVVALPLGDARGLPLCVGRPAGRQDGPARLHERAHLGSDERHGLGQGDDPAGGAPWAPRHAGAGPRGRVRDGRHRGGAQGRLARPPGDTGVDHPQVQRQVVPRAHDGRGAPRPPRGAQVAARARHPVELERGDAGGGLQPRGGGRVGGAQRRAPKSECDVRRGGARAPRDGHASARAAGLRDDREDVRVGRLRWAAGGAAVPAQRAVPVPVGRANVRGGGTERPPARARVGHRAGLPDGPVGVVEPLDEGPCARAALAARQRVAAGGREVHFGQRIPGRYRSRAHGGVAEAHAQSVAEAAQRGSFALHRGVLV